MTIVGRTIIHGLMDHGIPRFSISAIVTLDAIAPTSTAAPLMV